MLRRIKDDPEWLGEISDIDTSAVGDGSPLVIHRPAQDAAGNTWYTVTAGTQIGIFTSWYAHYPPTSSETRSHLFRLITGSYTQGKSLNVYRCWTTRMAAFRAFQLALVLGSVRVLPNN